jgi:hypothetical protein
VYVGYAVGDPSVKSDTGALGPARDDHVRFVFEATRVTVGAVFGSFEHETLAIGYG